MHTQYNPDYDDRFPAESLWAAFHILSNQGHQNFEAFCNSNNMPLSDRKRVLAKWEKETGTKTKQVDFDQVRQRAVKEFELAVFGGITENWVVFNGRLADGRPVDTEKSIELIKKRNPKMFKLGNL